MATLVLSVCATLGLLLACLATAEPAAGRSRWLPSDRGMRTTVVPARHNRAHGHASSIAPRARLACPRARLGDGAARSLEAFGARRVENAATRGSGPSVRAHQGQKRSFGKMCSGPATGVQAMALGPLPFLLDTAERLHSRTDVAAAPGNSGEHAFHAPRGPPAPFG